MADIIEKINREEESDDSMVTETSVKTQYDPEWYEEVGPGEGYHLHQLTDDEWRELMKQRGDEL